MQNFKDDLTGFFIGNNSIPANPDQVHNAIYL